VTTGVATSEKLVVSDTSPGGTIWFAAPSSDSPSAPDGGSDDAATSLDAAAADLRPVPVDSVKVSFLPGTAPVAGNPGHAPRIVVTFLVFGADQDAPRLSFVVPDRRMANESGYRYLIDLDATFAYGSSAAPQELVGGGIIVTEVDAPCGPEEACGVLDAVLELDASLGDTLGGTVHLTYGEELVTTSTPVTRVVPVVSGGGGSSSGEGCGASAPSGCSGSTPTGGGM
jgi:hypothetical protein